MNASVQTMRSMTADTKPLWAAVGVLGFAVLAMGASLVYVQTRPADGHIALAALTPPAPIETVNGAAKVSAADSLKAQEDLVAPPPKPLAKPVPATAPAGPVTVRTKRAPAPAVQATPSAAPTGVTEYGPIANRSVTAPVKQVCAACGTIESVTAVRRQGSGSGVGAVAGGAMGPVRCKQICKGSGRAMGTNLGAVGGGVAGNMIEKNVKKDTVYQVRVRMEDGSLHTVEQSSLPAVG
ncbi:MAG: hypothetical protein LH632_10470, partial [Rhodoferax sp.]|nr:hypothetical protein [Rhodoferax sp.]